MIGRNDGVRLIVRAMKKIAILAAGALLLGSPTLATAADTVSPVVVELFTSQGCSSCPPADAYLGELARQPGIIALAFHVDYWDYIGWKDPLAIPQATERQRRYTQALGARYLYTPEMVIDGRQDATGSDRAAVSRLIRSERTAVPKVPLSVREQPGGRYTIDIPAADIRGTATVWMAVFDREHKTAVERGENSGRSLHDYNAVRELRNLGVWSGKPLQIPIDMALTPANGCAILLQADHQPGDGQGPILGAALVGED